MLPLVLARDRDRPRRTLYCYRLGPADGIRGVVPIVVLMVTLRVLVLVLAVLLTGVLVGAPGPCPDVTLVTTTISVMTVVVRIGVS